MADEDVKELRSTIASLLKDRIKSRIQTALLSEGANSVVMVPHIQKQVRVLALDKHKQLHT